MHNYIHTYIYILSKTVYTLNGNTQAWSWVPSTTFCPTPRSSAGSTLERWMVTGWCEMILGIGCQYHGDINNTGSTNGQ